MIDANEGCTEQDEKIAGLAHEAGKASIICVNKWDSIDKDNSTTNEFTKNVYNSLSYMTYAPLLFISAKTGQRVDKLYEHINYVRNQSTMRVSTGMLNDVLADAVARVQPPSDKGRRLKIYYMTQNAVTPPTFVMFCNRADLFHFSYQRYIENCLRTTFGFNGTPIRLVIRQKGDDENS
jgi:GTP-binding protein